MKKSRVSGGCPICGGEWHESDYMLDSILYAALCFNVTATELFMSVVEEFDNKFAKPILNWIVKRYYEKKEK